MTPPFTPVEAPVARVKFGGLVRLPNSAACGWKLSERGGNPAAVLGGGCVRRSRTMAHCSLTDSIDCRKPSKTHPLAFPFLPSTITASNRQPCSASTFTSILDRLESNTKTTEFAPKRTPLRLPRSVPRRDRPLSRLRTLPATAARPTASPLATFRSPRILTTSNLRTEAV